MPLFPRHRLLRDRTTNGHPARVIDVTPQGALTETDVQAALEGLQARVPVPLLQVPRSTEGDLTFYVRQDGSNLNDGLADTPQGAFRTITRAVQEASKYHRSHYNTVDPEWQDAYSRVTLAIGPGNYAGDQENGTGPDGWGWVSLTGIPLGAGLLRITSTTGVAADVEVYGFDFANVYAEVSQISFHSLFAYPGSDVWVQDCRVLYDGDGCGFQAQGGSSITCGGTIDIVASDPTPEHQFWAPFSAGYDGMTMCYNGTVVNLSGQFKVAQCAGIAYAYAAGMVFFRGTTFTIAPGTVLPKQATCLNGGIVQSNSHTPATFPGASEASVDYGSQFLGRCKFREVILPDSTTPASATAPGTKGRIAYDSNYLYVCTATNTWKRAALSLW